MKYAPKKYMENNKITQTVTVTVRKMTTPSLLCWNVISIVKNPKQRSNGNFRTKIPGARQGKIKKDFDEHQSINVRFASHRFFS